MEKFVCTHCGHHFETEKKETLVCPNCFWSTSIKKEEARVSSAGPSLSLLEKDTDPARIGLWIGGVLFAVLLVGIILFTARHLKRQDEILQKIQSKNAHVIATQAPELNLTSEERGILDRAASFDANRPLTEKESQVLAPRISLPSRAPQGIATPPWDQKQFETFLEETQAQHRIPLEWTYRRKLNRLFREHYLPAAQAFESKNFLKARDEWIRSLAFPVYRNDLRRHQGVVLTMFRPYINDTLSKIGAMNSLLSGGGPQAPEEQIKSAYQNLIDLLQKESWEEANAKVLEIEKLLATLEKSPRAVSPPPLPRETAQVDPDIQEVLAAQAVPPEAGLPDLTRFRQDLVEKEKVIQGRMPEALEGVRKQYEEALALIREGNWRGAIEVLQKIEFPEELAEDAQAKIEILDKLASPSLDSQKDSG